MCHKNKLNVPENNLVKELLLFKLENPSKENQYSLANIEHAKPNFGVKRTPLAFKHNRSQTITQHL
jgi:hypothetical protein